MTGSARVPLHVVSYAAEECERQRSGEMSVEWMVKGWLYARRHRNAPPILRDVLALGSIVEPRKASGGFRRYGVRVGWDVKMDWQQVPGAMERLLAAVPWWGAAERAGVSSAWRSREDYDVACDEWYRQYEEVHPFGDGNGRTGSLLWNWLRGTLLDPTKPPDFWGQQEPPLPGHVVRGLLRERVDRG